jgi:hypothetical protein
VSWAVTTMFCIVASKYMFLSYLVPEAVWGHKIGWDHNHGQEEFLRIHSSSDPFSLIMRVKYHPFLVHAG